MNRLSDHAREMLERYRSDIGPSLAQREAMVRAVERRIGGVPRGGGGGGASVVAWMAVVAIVVAIGGLMAWPREAGDRDPTPAAIVASEERVEPAIAAADEPAHARPAIAANVPAEPPEPTPAATIKEDTAIRAAVRPRRASRAAAAEPAPQVAEAPAAALVDEEVRLLREATAALRDGRSADARRGFDEHARRFPDGALVELREVGRAIMRCAASPAEGAAIVDAFAKRFGESPHLRRLQRECASEPTP